MRNTKRRCTQWLMLAVLFGAPALRVQAQASESRCGHAGRPWVALVFVGDEWPAPWRESVTADLRAGLRLRGLDVCALGTDGSEPPLALIQLGSPSRDHVSVSIEVHDSITEKRVLRDVDLHNVTADGRDLTVAQAAEELLRASWAELALDDAPAPSFEPPVEVTRAVQPKQLGGGRNYELGARFAVEYHSGGATLLGGDAFFGMWLGSRVGAEVAVGLRDGLRADAVHGSIDASALACALEAVVALVPRNPNYDLLAKAGAELLRLQLRGRGDAQTNGFEQAASTLSARVSLAARASVTRSLRVGVELGSGVPLQAAVATDSGAEVTGTSGIEIHAALGAGVVF